MYSLKINDQRNKKQQLKGKMWPEMFCRSNVCRRMVSNNLYKAILPRRRHQILFETVHLLWSTSTWAASALLYPSRLACADTHRERTDCSREFASRCTRFTRSTHFQSSLTCDCTTATRWGSSRGGGKGTATFPWDADGTEKLPKPTSSTSRHTIQLLI